ncbi:MAG TPA: cysteine--1-D-myo-inosityl 2-amino-2-deoxy-alpha-D-glucopyranoside ligase [Nocardioidaceae bacterium]|nr:cysteine--1-D-myo-inosityl 2-amino-2-deoxy-alpha-D-glucopyranoside ligase [Nocardioidaceae bacterium]
MRSWTTPEVPQLADRGHVPGPGLRLHDTATGSVGDATPSGLARMYVCGITPYDATHLGHAATYIAYDTICRVWHDAGLEVSYTQNVTDVDDPLLERATETGEDWRDLAERETELFRDDMTALRVLPPQDYVGAVESVPLFVELIERLAEQGAAYELDRDLYFQVHKDPAFGSLGGYDNSTMVALSAERGGDPERPGKRDRLDSLLWRAERPGEPSWDAPFGAGRPGWHTECAAIALDRLGMGFDVQGGGSDLIYPHHEMSASQAQVATGERPFAQRYVHAGMVGYDGEKMSKSRGNLVLVSRLRGDGTDPSAIRLAILAHHYRSDWEWTSAELTGASERLERWRQAARLDAGPDARPVVDQVRRALEDDLGTPGALSVVDAWASAALEGAGPDDADAPATVRSLTDALLGVPL